jgi:hypothetical protein
MATRKQKEELMQTLKFTPVKIRVLIQGYGGECYIGSVDRETYDFFKAKRIDVEQYVNDWDGELFSDVPDHHRFCSPGSPYDCDNLFHGSGATMDSGSYITVEDESGNTIWESDLDISNLEAHGVQVECYDDFDSADLPVGSVTFWGGQGEKGCFFDAELTLRAPFDPKLLKVTYGNGDDWYLSGTVEYAGEDLEGLDGYSTSGKWTEHKFHIVGDEEVYQGVEREEIDVLENEKTWAIEAIDTYEIKFTEDQKTPWYSNDVKPMHEGLYEVEFSEVKWPWPSTGMYDWSNDSWQVPEELEVKRWRGLNNPQGQ